MGRGGIGKREEQTPRGHCFITPFAAHWVWCRPFCVFRWKSLQTRSTGSAITQIRKEKAGSRCVFLLHFPPLSVSLSCPLFHERRIYIKLVEIEGRDRSGE